MADQLGQRSKGLERTQSYQWPSGHLAHLTEGELTNLERFKQLCLEQGYYAPGDDKSPPTHDDETLLRYLRARKFVPQEAFKQFKDTEDWRRDNKLEDLYETIDLDEYEATRRLYPQWTGRRDKRGIPFYVFEVGDLDIKAVSSYSNSKDKQKHAGGKSGTPWKMLKLFALYENLCRFVLPLCSALPDREHAETPISQSNNIVDISGVGFGKFWQLRNHMSDASNLATAHYPETLDRIFVVGAPSFFPTVWQWAQKWFDPITVSKIFILSNKDMAPTLLKYVNKEDLPKKFGGDLDWTFGDMPSLEPAIAERMSWHEDIQAKGGYKTFPKGPMKWQYDDNGEMLATAIGTEAGGQRRNRVIAALKPGTNIAKLAFTPGRADKGLVYRSGSKLDVIPASTLPATEASTHESSTLQVPGNTNNDLAPASSMADADPPLTRSVSSTGMWAPAPTLSSATTDNTNTSTQPPPSDPTTNPSSPAQPPPTNAVDDTRPGTSITRYEQQSHTHAAGTLAEGTPHIRRDGKGEKQAVMEPHTVGQAPKVHPPPAGDGRARGGEFGPAAAAASGEGPSDAANASYLEQAKGVAGNVASRAGDAVGAVKGAVGLGGPDPQVLAAEEEARKREEEARRQDPVIDDLKGGNVEEFLRETTMSRAQA